MPYVPFFLSFINLVLQYSYIKKDIRCSFSNNIEKCLIILKSFFKDLHITTIYTSFWKKLSVVHINSHLWVHPKSKNNSTNMSRLNCERVGVHCREVSSMYVKHTFPRAWGFLLAALIWTRVNSQPRPLSFDPLWGIFKGILWLWPCIPVEASVFQLALVSTFQSVSLWITEEVSACATAFFLPSGKLLPVIWNEGFYFFLLLWENRLGYFSVLRS